MGCVVALRLINTPSRLWLGCLCRDSIWGCFVLFETVNGQPFSDPLWESVIYVGKFQHPAGF